MSSSSGVGQECDVRRQVIGKDSQVMLINRPRVDPPGQRLDLKSGLVPGLVHGWARRQTDSLRG